MKYVVVGICIVAVAIIIALLIYRKKKTNIPEGENNSDSGNGEMIAKQNSELSQPDQKLDELVIQMEMLPAEAISDESKLVEITDSKVLARVNNLVPGLAQAGIAGSNAVQAAKAGNEVLYRAIIPAGAKLTNSQAMEGAVRGFYRGADGIQGHANLVAVQAQKGTAVVANTAAAAMGVASMVVGQYYMTQINAELGEISDGISKISDFQDNEFRSRVFSLVAHVKKIADFQIEIIENDELRLSKIAQLDSLEEECTQLLGQANLTLAGYAKKNDLDYTAYEKELKEAQNWYKRNHPKDALYVDRTYIDYNDSREHRNIVISEVLSVIDDVILFRLSNYFLKVSKAYKEIKEVDQVENDWYEFVEYGSTNKQVISVQRHGFTRESAIYILKHPEYVANPEPELKLKRSIETCGNRGVCDDMDLVKYNLPDLFVD